MKREGDRKVPFRFCRQNTAPAAPTLPARDACAPACGRVAAKMRAFFTEVCKQQWKDAREPPESPATRIRDQAFRARSPLHPLRRAAAPSYFGEKSAIIPRDPPVHQAVLGCSARVWHRNDAGVGYAIMGCMVYLQRAYLSNGGVQLPARFLGIPPRFFSLLSQRCLQPNYAAPCPRS